jgi:hypothetical protein
LRTIEFGRFNIPFWGKGAFLLIMVSLLRYRSQTNERAFYTNECTKNDGYNDAVDVPTMKAT